MDIKIFNNAEEIAVAAAQLYKELIVQKPNAVLGLATGATPVPTYKKIIELYNNGEISFKEVTTFNLDEYCDLDKNDKNSYYTFMHENLFNHVDIKSLKDLLHFTWGSEAPISVYDMTLLFSIFVWTHFWYMFDARAFETSKSLFRLKMSQGFWTIVLIIVIGQLFITELVPNFFNVEPMLRTADWKWNPSGAEDLGIIILASSAVVWVRELYILATWPFRKNK